LSRGFHFLTSDFVDEPVFVDELLGPVWGTFTFETVEVGVLEGFSTALRRDYLDIYKIDKGPI
jgi:hypothetical protein